MTTAAGGDGDADPAAAATWWPAALVFLLACLPYVETPSFEFVSYDDPDHVAGHAIVGRGLTARGMAWAFGFGTDPATDGWFNWPLTWLSHMTDATVFGGWAGGHHAVNVLLHAVNAVLVLALVRRLGLTLPGGLLAAAVFAVHPGQVESVAWVSERKTVLCACLMFQTVLVYLRWRDERHGRSAFGWLLAWNALAGLALLAKPLAVTLPCVLLLIDAMPLGRVRGASLAEWLASLARCLPEKVPMFVLAAATCAWTVASQSEAGAVQHLSLATRSGHAVVAYATYVSVFLLPSGLGCFHPHPGMPTAAAFVAALAAMLGLSAVVAAAAVRGRPLALFGWYWFLGTMVPMIGIIQVGSNGWSDRYLYVPIVGLATSLAALVEWGVAAARTRRLPRAATPRAGLWPAALASAWVVGLAYLAFGQARTWRDDESLAVAAVAASPESSAAWNMLASLHVARRQSPEAVQAARRALAHDPGNESALINLGIGLAGVGEQRHAEAALRSAAQLTRATDRWLVATYNVGRLMLEMDRDGEAAEAFAGVLRRSPGHAAARRGLGVALTRLGDPSRAVAVFRQAVSDHPDDADAWVGLGNALYRLDRSTEAVACYDRALDLAPDDPEVLMNRAWARLEAGDRAGAESDASAAANLGLALSRLGLFDAAVAAFREALERDPGNEAARAGLQDAGAKRAAAAPSRASGGPAREGDEAGRGPGEQGGEEEPPRPPLAEE